MSASVIGHTSLIFVPDSAQYGAMSATPELRNIRNRILLDFGEQIKVSIGGQSVPPNWGLEQFPTVGNDLDFVALAARLSSKVGDLATAMQKPGLSLGSASADVGTYYYWENGEKICHRGHKVMDGAVELTLHPRGVVDENQPLTAKVRIVIFHQPIPST